MFQGSSFSQSFVETASGLSSKSLRKYISGSRPFCLAVSISEYIPQELSAPSGLLLNSQFLRPITNKITKTFHPTNRKPKITNQTIKRLTQNKSALSSSIQ